MKAIDRRIRRLQHQLCPDGRPEQRLRVVAIVGREFAFDRDRCIEILGESDFLPKTRFGVVDLCGIPDGLNAKELEKYLRTNGTKAPGFGPDKQQSVPSGANWSDETSRSSQAQISALGQMKGHGAKFERKKELAIAALLTHRSVEDAARAVDLNPNTLLTWLKIPAFLKVYRAARREVVHQSVARLQQSSGSCRDGHA